MMLQLCCIALCTLTVFQTESLEMIYQPKVFETEQGDLPYRFLTPEKFGDGETYPLVIFLHGAGERGIDNKKQLVHGLKEFVTPANRKNYPCFIIAPQAPEEKRWVEVEWTLDEHTMPETPSEPLRLTFELIGKLTKELPIDRSRIYITGLSMGGYGTWDALQRKPELFAAAVPVCGGGDETQAGKLEQIPIWAFHGDKDTVVKPHRSVNMVEAVNKAGGEAKLTMYEGVGHNSWNQVYADPAMMKWLFSQRKPTPAKPN
ncbi:MAG TPA: prolyl oligopeptidase family serine peptidase [Planctomycetaceae bacterium]|nr:prolyl oligopeptidase family serine peptidase [Planctomycetaceae bacterium]